jgi:SSS family solute:Na+ symporter
MISLYGSRKIQTEKGFFVANRSLGWFPITATITATSVGGSATIATGALVYRSGLPGLWIDIGGACGLIILGLLLAKKVRQTGSYTLPEIIGSLFNKRVKYVATVLIMITQIAWISLLIQSTGIIIFVLLNAQYEIILSIITIIFICYTLIGGQFAVVYTDIIQFFVMVIGLCVIAAPILFFQTMPLLSQVPPNHMNFPINSHLGILPVLSFFFMMVMPHIVGPDIYSKLLSAKDGRSAKIGAILSGFWKLIFAIAIGLISISATVLYPNLENASLAIPTAVSNLSPLLAGILLAAFLSVMLSSTDSVLLSAGTIFSVDITQKNTIMTTRVGILFIGIVALILSLYLQDVINTLELAYTVFTAGLTLPIIFGFYKEKTRVTSTGALWSLILGGGISLLWLILDSPYVDAVLVGLLFSIIPLLLLRDSCKLQQNYLKSE